ncbi:CYFA0S02e11232g1_1 [Cyberlindnera fabianii]|uniref:RNA-binding protein VTS1 n=1 Tax=Cyberlindnera fabianii TaxID=36022 RepID=A0A061APH7_CYBFA|nr:CYFA0S02e11232g1_1 [Cyberlindnera fabianii]
MSEESEMEKRFEEGVLGTITSSSPPPSGNNSVSNVSNRQHPGAALLSPKVQASNTPSILMSPQPFAQSGGQISGLLSPSGSRYKFESEEPEILAPRPMSPIIDTSMSGFNNRPLSAQDFNSSFGSNTFDAFRPFSAQPVQSEYQQQHHQQQQQHQQQHQNQHQHQQQQQQPSGVPERPMSAMEIDSFTFKNDVSNLVNWLGSLNSNQQRSVIDNLLSNLPEDILAYARTKVEDLTYQKQSEQSHIVAPQPLYQSSSMHEPATLDSILNGSQQPWSPPTAASNLQRALSPNFVSPMDRSSVLVHEAAMLNRPRSADPYSKTPSKNRGYQYGHNNENVNYYANNQSGQQQGGQGQRAFDITNLAQQLTAQQLGGGGSNSTSSNSNNNSNNGNNNNTNNNTNNNSNSGMDYNNMNALKLSALSTINSRVQLDSGKNRKHTDDRGRHLTNDDYNRTSSVPPPQRVNYYESLHNQGKDLSKMASLNSATKGLTLDDSNSLTPLKSPQSPTSGQPKSPAINPKQITNPKLLADIPSWLKTLRLHKYTPCLQDTPWKELIYFDDEKLTQKGVTAMGARGKLLKAFEVVRQYYEDGLIPSASA